MSAVVNEALTPAFRVAHIEAATAWYTRLGFDVEYEHSSGPAFSQTTVLLKRGELALILTNRDEDAAAVGLIYLQVADVNAVAEEFAVGVKQSIFGSHLELCDPDGNRLRIVQPNINRTGPGGRRGA